jgi:hypothetical protein
MTGGLKYPPFAHPRRGTPARPIQAVEALPSIDEFLDELPSIDDFLEQDVPLVVNAEEFEVAGQQYEGSAEDDLMADFEDSPEYADSADETDTSELDMGGLDVTSDQPRLEKHNSPAQGVNGWAAGDWQSYDWGSLAGLNRNAPISAAESWGETDWPLAEDTTSAPQTGRSVNPDADEIANALDGIARRIRSGELVIDNLHGIPPEAAMAAALAVLLRMRG